MREVAGLRMGPFELFDLTGLDVSFPVTRRIYGQSWHDPRLRPTHLPANRVAAGLLGRKTGEGFHAYDPDGRIRRPAPPPVPDAAPVRAFATDPDLAEALGLPTLSPGEVAPAGR